MRTTEDQRAIRAAHRVHKIVEVRFVQTAAQGRPSSEAPVLCSCSEVTTSREWDQHRGGTVNVLTGGRP